MGDLHSIASLNSSHSLGWDYHDLEFINADMSHFLESTPPFFSFPLDSDISTGYLQDALFKFSSKRRRLVWLDDDLNNEATTDAFRGSWNFFEEENPYGDFGYLFDKKYSDSISGESIGKSLRRINEDGNVFSGMETSTSDSMTSSQKGSAITVPTEPNSPSEGCGGGGMTAMRKKRVLTRVVYPFAMVKPGGVEGDLTLNDINERILMPPTRPVRHPVGDFACRPMVSPDGQGLSGKAVVAFTRIQTRGRGTITITRTKG